MAQSKCSLLKPVNNLTGTFFLFSQYTQDLTKQYSNPDSYRCLPSKFIAMNLSFENIKQKTSSVDFYAKKLGEIFQNYFENSCSFLRNEYKDNWLPEYSRTLLFQTLEKYNLLTVDNIKDSNGNIIEDSGISKNIQYIGDIDIYSYNDNADGIGYNEIYCYISNQAKCIDYSFGKVSQDLSVYPYKNNQICGYENKTPYNGLTYNVISGDNIYVDAEYKAGSVSKQKYSIGQYTELNNTTEQNILYTYIPCILDENMTNISNEPRLNDEGTELEKFNINSFVILYDIVSKYEEDGVVKENIIHKNIPLGIYFTGNLDENCIMSNQIVKYVDSEQIYNQGTSYGLRICNRFISNPYSTEIIETETVGSSNVSEIAPVLNKIEELLIASEDVIKGDNDIYTVMNNHLSQFKNNKVNIPYVRELGKKKYWFVNGKNTGAIAQDETTDLNDLAKEILAQVLNNVYTKTEVDNIRSLKNYYTKEEINTILGSSSEGDENYVTKAYVDACFEKLKADLKIYTQFD